VGLQEQQRPLLQDFGRKVQLTQFAMIHQVGLTNRDQIMQRMITNILSRIMHERSRNLKGEMSRNNLKARLPAILGLVV
jgi:hypothetical protein